MAVYTPAEFFPVYGTKTMDDSVEEGAANLDACVEGDDCVAHIYPDGPGTTSTYVVVGHSLGALTASLVKQDLIERYQDDPDESPDTSVILLANAMRPNGGVLARGFKGLTIPFLEITFYEEQRRRTRARRPTASAIEPLMSHSNTTPSAATSPSSR